MTFRIHRGRGRVRAAAATATVAAVLIATAGCSRQPPPAPVAPAPDPSATARAAWNDFASAFIESYFKSHPFFAVQSGRHEFDGQMSDWSAAGFQKEVDRLKQLRTQALGLSAQGLEPAQRLEQEYLLSVIDNELFWLDQARAPFKNPAWYINNLDPEVYLSRDYAPLEKRLTGYLGYARAIPQLTAPGTVEERFLLPSFLYLSSSQEFPEGSLVLPWNKKLAEIVGEFARSHGAKVPVRLVSSAKSWLSHAGVDREEAFANLQIFPRFYETAEQLRTWLATHKV